MSEEDNQYDTPFDDTEENLKEPSEEQFSPPPMEEYGYGEDAEIIESEDLTKKKKRKKIWLILILVCFLPILIIIGILVFLGFLAAGLLETCITNCGVACCESCADSCNESCAQSCNNACGNACENACESSCENACDSCTCNCNSSSARITLKETINSQLKLVKWYFMYIFGIFKM